MSGFLTKAGMGIALAATAITAAAPADAQRWGGYRGYRGHRGGDTAAAAILGGVVGLGVGAAIASSNRDRYYDRGYYGYNGYYGPRYRPVPRGYYRDYYAPPPPRVVYREYYRDPYYGGGYGAPRGYYGR